VSTQRRARPYRINWLRANPDIAKALLDLSGPKRKHDLPALVTRHHPTLVQKSILVQADTVTTPAGSKNGLYALAANAVEDCELAVETNTLLPCGHVGFRNLRDGDYACRRYPEFCDCEYDRETIIDLYGGDSA